MSPTKMQTQWCLSVFVLECDAKQMFLFKKAAYLKMSLATMNQKGLAIN